VRSGRVAEAEALRASDSPNNLRIRLDRRRSSTGAPTGEPQLRLVPLVALPRTRTL
jgi:Tfp pilus assembly ATPase PilU